MYHKITNTYGLLYPSKPKFLYRPLIKTLGENYSEITKEKRNLYFKRYKKLLKLKSKNKRNLRKNLIKPLPNPQILLLNTSLTQKKICNLEFLSTNVFYKSLNPVKFKAEKLDGYSQYYDKIFGLTK